MKFIKLLLPTPLEVVGERYWIAYFYQTTSPDTKNLFIAVSDNTGLLERDSEKLTKIFAITYKLGVAESLKQGKASLEDIEAFLTEAEKLRQAAEDVLLRSVKQQIEVKHPEISFNEIEAALNDLKGSQERLRDSMRETRSLKSQFELYGTEFDFENYFAAYNATFGQFNEVARIAGKYQAAVLAKADETANSPSLNFSDKQEIKAALEKLYDVGDYKGFKSGVTDPAMRVVASQLQRQPGFVNNSVESTLYRIAKKNAEAGYSGPEVRQAVTALLAQGRESELRACAVDVTELKRAWSEVRGVMENPVNASRPAYEAIPEKVGEVQRLAEAAAAKLTNCLEAPAPVQAPRQDNTLQNALVALLAIVLLYYGYSRYKKWREESE